MRAVSNKKLIHSIVYLCQSFFSEKTPCYTRLIRDYKGFQPKRVNFCYSLGYFWNKNKVIGFSYEINFLVNCSIPIKKNSNVSII